METERMIYLVTEYASGGEIFGKYIYCCFNQIMHTEKYGKLNLGAVQLLVQLERPFSLVTATAWGWNMYGEIGISVRQCRSLFFLQRGCNLKGK